jgi:hypothetical protein
MKKITVSVDDETYRLARAKAAKMNTSLSALVRRFLVELAGQETDFERLKRLEEEVLASIRGRSFSASDRLTRDEVHERKPSRKRRAVR